jgi:glycosyltransferase involved in cell wall biosynthesis
MYIKPAAVLIPTYNVQDYLAEAIESILGQTYIDFDLLILDDGSTDETVNIIKSYAQKDKRVRLFENEKNEGIIESRNKLFEISKNKYEYLVIMDSDDIAHPKRIEKQISFLKKHRKYDVVSSEFKVIPYGLISQNSVFNGKIAEEMIFINIINNPSTTLRANIVEQYNLHYDPEYRGSSDYKFWVDALEHSKFYILKECLLEYRRHGTQESTFNRGRQRRNAIRLTQLQLQRLLPDTTYEIAEKIVFSKYLSLEERMDVLAFYKKMLQKNQELKVFDQSALSSVIKRQIVNLFVHVKRKSFIKILSFLRLRDIFCEPGLMKDVLVKLVSSQRKITTSPLSRAEILHQKLLEKNILQFSLYGTGEISEALIRHTIKKDGEGAVEKIFDSKALSGSYQFLDRQVLSPNVIGEIVSKVIVIASFEYRHAILKTIQDILGNDFKEFTIIMIEE